MTNVFHYEHQEKIEKENDIEVLRELAFKQSKFTKQRRDRSSDIFKVLFFYNLIIAIVISTFFLKKGERFYLIFSLIFVLVSYVFYMTHIR